MTPAETDAAAILKMAGLNARARAKLLTGDVNRGAWPLVARAEIIEDRHQLGTADIMPRWRR